MMKKILPILCCMSLSFPFLFLWIRGKGDGSIFKYIRRTFEHIDYEEIERAEKEGKL